MSRAPITLEGLSPDEKTEFKRLTSAPPLAIPTIVMLVALTITFLSMYVLCVAGWLPLWVGMLTNSVVGYVGFSIIHDSVHRSAAKDTRLNDRIGQFALLLVLPYVDIKLFRWAHIRHHRFASGERDPDRFFSGAWYTLPFRWMLIDVWYFIYAWNHGDKISWPPLKKTLRNAAFFFALVGAAIWAGYGWHVLMLWFIPSRLILVSLGFSFFWLPHVPHDTTQEENFIRATTLREGHEWLMRPLLQYQHVHLIHHLYPMTPFYNNERVYKLIKPELEQHERAVQRGLSIRPTIYKGSAAH